MDNVLYHNEQQQTALAAPKEFRLRLDFYWQAVSFYAISLLLYAGITGSFSDEKLTLLVTDPIVELLLLVTLASTVWVLTNSYMRRSLVIGDNVITFRNRFRERVFHLNDIHSITIVRENSTGHRSASRVVVLRVANRHRPFRIRVALYEQDKELFQELKRLRRLHAEQ